jgi:hypothetical protein
VEDPEISRFKKNTNFLRGRTFCQDPRNPEKVVRTPRNPKKVVRTPGFPGIGRFPGFWGSGPPETGNSRGDGPDSPETAVFPVSGGGQKSRKLPPDTRTVPENDRLQLMPPPWDLCLFAPGGGPELGAVTPNFITRPQTRHRRGSIWSASLDGTVTSSQFKTKTYVQTPRNGRFPGFWGSGPTFWGPRARNPGIRGLDQETGVWRSRNPGILARKPGIRGKKIPNWDPPPRNCPTQNPGTRDRKKTDIPPPKKSHPPKKRDRTTLQTPPCLQH